MTSLTIPKSVTYIGIQAFSGCRERTDVYCYPKDVPETDNYVFARYGSDLEGMILHVPANSIEAYKTAKQWKDFGKIVPLNDEPIIAGDVTGNGSVNVQDATIVVNYILGTEINDEYDYSVADMNEDGEIDVFDVTKMIAIILIEESSAKLRKAMSVQEPTIVEQLTMENVADGIALHVDNVNRFTSFQMDVEVPNGNSLTGVRPANNESGHIIRYAKIGENLYRVMALSMSSTPLKASANGLLELDLTNGEDVQIDNILFVTPKGEAVQFGALSDNIVTDIKSVGTSDAEEIYDLSGRKMNVRREQLPRGIYIINQKKVVIK